MLKNLIVLATLPVLLVATFAAAEAPAQDQSKAQPQITTTVKPTTTLTGCLYREDQVPGRKPDVAERAGILEDYILADTTVADPQQQPRPAAGPATGTSGTVASTGTMYKVEKISGEKLKTLVGKRVEVAGHIDPEGRSRLGVGGGPQPDKGLGPDTLSLPEIEASSIREVSGKCPASPSPGR